MELFQFIESHWKELVATFVAIFGLWKYIDSRKKELDWKKTEFLFDQSRYLDTDSDIQYAESVIDGELQKSIQELISNEGKFTTDDKKFREGLHKLLNMLDRLTYAVKSRGSINMQEVSHFGWYFTSVSRNKLLVKYCNKNGYKQVLAIAEHVEAHFKQMAKK